MNSRQGSTSTTADLSYEAALRGHEAHAEAVRTYRQHLNQLIAVGIAVLVFIARSVLDDPSSRDHHWLLWAVCLASTAGFVGFGVYSLRLRNDLVFVQDLPSIVELQDEQPDQIKLEVAFAISEGVTTGQARLTKLLREMQILLLTLGIAATTWGLLLR